MEEKLFSLIWTAELFFLNGPLCSSIGALHRRSNTAKSKAWDSFTVRFNERKESRNSKAVQKL